MKKELSGHHFDYDDDVRAAVDNFLKTQNANFHKEGICLLTICWTKNVFFWNAELTINAIHFLGE